MMEKDEILKKSREENAGKHDEREMAAFGAASKVGMLVGCLICVALTLVSSIHPNAAEIGLVGWLLYFAMQGSHSIALFVKLRSRKRLVYGVVELLLAVAFAVALVFKALV
ncbi:MAG: hypothetical protein IJW29_02515 [Clostridia bacterium]|nr:hypothetical protein [Clostridia bacterium]